MKNKVLMRAAGAVILIICIVMTCYPVCGFNSSTHRRVTSVGLENIAKMNDELLKKKNEKILFNKKEENYWKIVEDFSIKPDEDENQGAYKYHFYNFINEKNYMGERDSALTRCKEHFQNAVKNYKQNNKKKAYEELGRALHFIEDLNTPVHTVYQMSYEAVVKFPLHVKFEKECDDICKECNIRVNFDNMKYYDVNSLDTICKSSAVLSENNFSKLEEKISKSKFIRIAKNAVYNAQEKVTGILYKFFNEIKK